MKDSIEDKTHLGQLTAELAKFGGMDKSQATKLTSLLMPHIQRLIDQAVVEELEQVAIQNALDVSKGVGDYLRKRLAELEKENK